MTDTALDRAYPLTPSDIARFNRDGFIQLESVFDRAILEKFGPEITAQTLARNTQTRPLDERDVYDRAFLQVMNLWEHSAIVSAFVRSKTLARIAAELLGVAGVRLYHDQALYKEPGGGITPAHADQYYWPLASDRAVTAWIPLQDTPAEMGPLGFYVGSQHEPLGRDLAISDESEAAITAAMAARDYPFHCRPFALGDVSFHLGWTFHKAGPNTTRAPRAVMTIIYMDADMRLADRLTPAQANDRAQWCPGAIAGAVIDTAKNPVLYRA